MTAEDRVVAVRSDTEVRESAAQGARVVGRLATGSTVRSMGRSGALLKVDLGTSGFGFIASSATAPSTGRPAPRFTETMQQSPPAIAMAEAALQTSEGRIRLTGTARDEDRVLDMYVFSGNNKVYYLSNRRGQDPHQVSFSADVPLNLGANFVTIVARQSPDVVARRTIVVRRDNADGTTAFTPRTPPEELTE